MFQDDYNAFRKGKLTNERALQSMLTDVAARLYAYAVMLDILDRNTEAKFFEDIRTKLFDIRSKVGADTTQEGFDELSNDMNGIYQELNTAYIYLHAHKPDEATILQSTANAACGLVFTIKHFRDPVL
jgi:hypothetical protein